MHTSTGSTAMGTATVDLRAIAHNLRVLSDVAGAGVLAVVKADGYGHGALPVARTLVDAGAVGLGVAHITEALALREGGIDAPITSWLHAPDTDFEAGIAADVDIAVSSTRQLAAVVDAAGRRGETATLTVKVDTGMNRSGVARDEWSDFVDAFARARAAGAVRLRGVMAHLACGDEPANPVNDAQAAALTAAVADLRKTGAIAELVHLANSPAALTRPDLAFDAVRPGIAVYGLNPVPQHSDADLIPAMTLRTRVSLVKKVAAGEGVSYGHTFVAPVDTVVAVIPVGYADGVPRALSGRLRVRIDGRDFPGIGRICMDQFVVDLGPDGGGVGEGDEVTVFGTGIDGGPTAREWADLTDTIDYEIVTGIGPRIARRYLGGLP
ncbi:alanine racemase [Gordonia araii NBRC 100433]|uniref:Alanine racemase n=1 Tax=Gordonia araii NBRC 100433 TaxID=1073574 RepID=G7GZ85_9ACTN|nr:alanine racemase [Gordonia araii]NNG97118.1 alanine racemase [Gordonia araii NBRC 100433]GAB08910.1 alanine racemase [Gordonia araii NBRC 100433]